MRYMEPQDHPQGIRSPWSERVHLNVLTSTGYAQYFPLGNTTEVPRAVALQVAVQTDSNIILWPYLHGGSTQVLPLGLLHQN